MDSAWWRFLQERVMNRLLLATCEAASHKVMRADVLPPAPRRRRMVRRLLRRIRANGGLRT